jgi:hypothetical protein
MADGARRAHSNSGKIWGVLTILCFSAGFLLLNHNMIASYPTARDPDRAGIDCLYSISAHVLRCTLNGSRQTEPLIVGPDNVTSGTGVCRDNPQCVGRKYKQTGPIEPGRYRINPDTRTGGKEIFRLEPVPPVPGWRVWLPGWMPGALRGGFLLGPGSLITHGCIMVRKIDRTASAQYKKLEELLNSQPGAGNTLEVLP